jgi:hypothetical protein
VPIRQPARPSLVASALSTLVLGSAGARAGGGNVELRIDCPALDEAGLAALEARSRAEMTSARLPAGEVSIVCKGGSAALTWQRLGGKRRESDVGLGSEPSLAVDAILTALDALLFEKQGETQGPDEPDAASSAGPTSTEPAAAPSAVDPPPPTPPVEPSATRMQDGLPTLPPSYGVGLTLGMDSELWSGGIEGGIGPRAGVRFRGPGRWSANLSGGALWGTNATQGVHSQVLRVVAGLDYDLWPHVLVGAGADARVLFAGQGGASESQATTAGAVVSARYLATLGAFSLSAGPQAELLVRPLIVQVGGAEIFRIPTAIASLAVEGSADFGR